MALLAQLLPRFLEGDYYDNTILLREAAPSIAVMGCVSLRTGVDYRAVYKYYAAPYPYKVPISHGGVAGMEE